MEAPERHDVAASSLGVDESPARRWVVPTSIPSIAKLRIRQVDPRDVSGWLLTVGSTAGIPTARTARSVLATVFRSAIAKGHASPNPVRNASRPAQHVVDAACARLQVQKSAKRPGPGVNFDHARALNLAEVGRLLETASSTPERRGGDLAHLVAFLDGTAMRFGAALAALEDNLGLDGDCWAVGTDLGPRRVWFQMGIDTITRVAGIGLVRSGYGSTKRIRHLCDSCAGDDGNPMMWVAPHTFRRTLVTDSHDADNPDKHIAGRTGHGRIGVLQDHSIARLLTSTIATYLRGHAPRSALPHTKRVSFLPG